MIPIRAELPQAGAALVVPDAAQLAIHLKAPAILDLARIILDIALESQDTGDFGSLDVTQCTSAGGANLCGPSVVQCTIVHDEFPVLVVVFGLGVRIPHAEIVINIPPIVIKPVGRSLEIPIDHADG